MTTRRPPVDAELSFFERVQLAMHLNDPRAFPEPGAITQREVAKIAEVTQPSVHKWQEPDKFPETKHVVRIAKKTGVCVEWLFTGRPPRHPVDAMNANTVRLLELWHSLDDFGKGELLGTAKQLVRDQRDSKRAPGIDTLTSLPPIVGKAPSGAEN